MQYEPSSSQGLNYYLRIQVCVGWIDAKSDVVDIKMAAFVSASEFSANAPIKNGNTAVYRGSYAPDTVRRHLVPMLYRALNAAHELRKSAKGSAVVHTLDLEETPK
jgi:hypothetical protein